MGLNRNTKVRALNSVLTFGQCKNSTIEEVIDDGQCSLIQYYIDNVEDFELDNEAYNYLRRECKGNNKKCSCNDTF